MGRQIKQPNELDVEVFINLSKDYLVICDFCGAVDEWTLDKSFVFCKQFNAAICENCIQICNEIIKRGKEQINECNQTIA